MHQVRASALFGLTVAGITLLVLCCGCGTGSGTGSQGPQSISPAQATAAALQVQHTLIASVDTLTSMVCPLPPCCNINNKNYCNLAIATQAPCSGGGTIGLAGSVSGYMDFYGTGDTTGALTLTPTNCSIQGTNLVMDANTSLTLNSEVFFYYGTPYGVTVTETGPITYGPKPSGVCQANLTIAAQVSGNGQYCTVTGTACGQVINQSCL